MAALRAPRMPGAVVRNAARLEQGGLDEALRWLRDELGLPEAAAQQVARYLDATRRALGPPLMVVAAVFIIYTFFINNRSIAYMS